jgi:hypothetical protein
LMGPVTYLRRATSSSPSWLSQSTLPPRHTCARRRANQHPRSSPPVSHGTRRECRQWGRRCHRWQNDGMGGGRQRRQDSRSGPRPGVGVWRQRRMHRAQLVVRSSRPWSMCLLCAVGADAAVVVLAAAAAVAGGCAGFLVRVSAGATLAQPRGARRVSVPVPAVSCLWGHGQKGRGEVAATHLVDLPLRGSSLLCPAPISLVRPAWAW